MSKEPMAQTRRGRGRPPLPVSDAGDAANYGACVRVWRNHRDLTLEELARRARTISNGTISISSGHLSRLERGVVPIHDLQMLDCLARALDLDGAQMLLSSRPPTTSGESGAESVLAILPRLTVEDRVGLIINATTRTSHIDHARRTRQQVTPIKLWTGRDVFATAVQLLESVPDVQPSVGTPDPGRDAPEILLSFQAGADIYTLAEWQAEWLRALQTALERGWNVVHLIPRGHEPQRALATLQYLIALLGDHTGNYRARYLPEGYSAHAHAEYVIVPGHGAVRVNLPQRAMDIDWTRDVNGYLYLPGNAKYLGLLKRFTTLRAGAQHVAEIYTRTDPAFTDAITRTEQAAGARCLVLDGVSEFFVHPDIHKWRGKQVSKKHPEVKSDIAKIVKSRRERRKELREHLANTSSDVKDLYLKTALQRLAKHGIYSRDDTFSELGADALSHSERIDVFNALKRHLIHFYPQHQIGLIEGEKGHESGLAELSSMWLVKQGYSVLLETWYSTRKGPWEQVDIEVRDADVADAFYRYFKTLWEALPIVKDRNEVIKWLDGRIKYVQRLQRQQRANGHGPESRQPQPAPARRADRAPELATGPLETIAPPTRTQRDV